MSTDERLIELLRTIYAPRLPDVDASDFDSEDLVFNVGDPADALLYSTLLFPVTVEWRGMVLLASALDSPEAVELAEGALAKYDGDLVATEESLNWIDLAAAFACAPSDLEDDVEEALAHRMRETWSATLTARYPDRRFVVSVLPPESTGYGFGVGFHEQRP